MIFPCIVMTRHQLILNFLCLLQDQPPYLHQLALLCFYGIYVISHNNEVKIILFCCKFMYYIYIYIYSRNQFLSVGSHVASRVIAASPRMTSLQTGTTVLRSVLLVVKHSNNGELRVGVGTLRCCRIIR
jgi:hypothetical protein